MREFRYEAIVNIYSNDVCFSKWIHHTRWIITNDFGTTEMINGGGIFYVKFLLSKNALEHVLANNVQLNFVWNLHHFKG